MAETRADYNRKFMADAVRAFASHQIISGDIGTGHWMLQRIHNDGKPDWIMAAEIVCIANGGLFVGGDIYPVVFKHGPDTYAGRVHWLGAHKDMSYVAEKATIGFGDDELVHTYNPEIALYDLSELAKDFVEDRDDVPSDHPMLIGLNEIREYAYDGHAALTDALREVGARSKCYGFVEERYGLGRVVAPRVYFAWGALARLSELL